MSQPDMSCFNMLQDVKKVSQMSQKSPKLLSYTGATPIRGIFFSRGMLNAILPMQKAKLKTLIKAMLQRMLLTMPEAT